RLGVLRGQLLAKSAHVVLVAEPLGRATPLNELSEAQLVDLIHIDVLWLGADHPIRSRAELGACVWGTSRRLFATGGRGRIAERHKVVAVQSGGIRARLRDDAGKVGFRNQVVAALGTQTPSVRVIAKGLRRAPPTDVLMGAHGFTPRRVTSART